MSQAPRIYSDSRIGRGGLVFISGQLPIRDDGSVPVEPLAQTEIVFAHIESKLAAHNLGWESVVKLTYFLRDMADLAAIRHVGAAVLPDPPPASSLVGVSDLVDDRCRIEIDAIAHTTL